MSQSHEKEARPEIPSSQETLETHEEAERIAGHETNEHHEAHKSQPEIDELVRNINHEALSSSEVKIGGDSERRTASPIGMQRELKDDAYRKTLERIRPKLSAPDRALSRVVHHPTVEKASEIGAKTIARPSGVMGGALGALIGSSFLLFMAKRYGFEYNYGLFFLLFLGGFGIGVVVELIIKLTTRKKRTD